MEVRSLPDILQEQANKELNEDSNQTQEAFDHIKEWIRKQPHLNVRKDDQIMMCFFRGCKWSLQKVKEKLDYYYSCRTLIPDFFMNRDPLSVEIQKVLKAGILYPLPPVENYFGPLVIVFNFKNVDVNETPYAVLVKLFFMCLEICMRESDNFVVSGTTFIGDHNKCPVSYYLQFTPTIMQQQVKCFEKAYPVRIRRALIINTLPVFEKIFNTVVKPVMHPKIKERVNVVSSSQAEELFKEIPENVRPKEYGGTNGTLKNAAETWKTKVESYREWFLEDAKYVSNEELRIERADKFEDGIGVDGTFRNLVID